MERFFRRYRRCRSFSYRSARLDPHSDIRCFLNSRKKYKYFQDFSLLFSCLNNVLAHSSRAESVWNQNGICVSKNYYSIFAKSGSILTKRKHSTEDIFGRGQDSTASCDGGYDTDFIISREQKRKTKALCLHRKPTSFLFFVRRQPGTAISGSSLLLL